MRKSPFLGYFLDSVNVAAVALMVAVLFVMSVDTLNNWRSIVIAVISLVITFGFKKMNSMWTVIGGSVLGYLLFLI
jgi:chromate transporter